ncbi:MAG: PIN domain-containing protein [Leptospiraceae bacterium]|nr:PIN domain-containing protein [Leptospiraceae bacterium]
MSYLLDVNVLIGLCDPNHSFHEKAWAWFDNKKKIGWATCPITENGLVRILSNPSYPNKMDDLEQAIGLLNKITQVEGHMFIPDDISFTKNEIFIDLQNTNQKHLTDIYLLGLCIKHKIRFATFDKKIPSTINPEGAKSIEIVG